MSGINVPLLRKAIEWAEAEAAKPEELCEWQQGFWVLPKSDHDPAAYIDVEELDVAKIRAYEGLAEECGTCFCIAGRVAHESGQVVSYSRGVKREAASLLGIDIAAAHRLFASNNTIEDVRRIAEEIAGERL